MKNVVFFRNDDVRDTLDKSLVDLTKLFIKYEIPIIHAVEPANITPEVIDWLTDLKKQYPSLIEIIQHGYDHQPKVIVKGRKGEFGGDRTYEEQYTDLKKGITLLNKYFNDNWFSAFTLPYGPYNNSFIKALNDCHFKVFSSHYNRKLSRQLFYFMGHLLGQGKMFGKRISWNLQYHPNTNLFEIDMNVSFIKKYHNEETDAELYSLEYLIEETKKYSKYRTIGILLHHRYHNSEEKIILVEDYLKWIKQQDYSFSTLKNIYEKFSWV